MLYEVITTHVPTPHLDGKHTVFGHVVDGQDVVDSIKNGDVMNKIEIIRVGEKAKNFVASQENFDKLKGTLAERAAEAFKKANEETIKKIKADYPDSEVSESGIYYTINEKGNGKKPSAGDQVSVHYTGSSPSRPALPRRRRPRPTRPLSSSA